MSHKVFTIMFCLIFLGLLQAKIINVPADQSTIQAAINAAVDGDTVLVAENTYFENINFKGKAITVGSHFLVDGDTTHINNTIIDGSQPSHPDSGSVVFFVSGEDTTSMICGFTITGGTGTLYSSQVRVGGGIFCETSGARIAHNKIISNAVTHDSDIHGGGIGCWPNISSNLGYVIIENNTIKNNMISSVKSGTWLNGGGMNIVRGRIERNIIRYNSVSGQSFAGGGGIAATGDDPKALVTIHGNTISHNECHAPGTYGGYGGGVDVVTCNVHLLNNTIAQNQVSGNQNFGAGVRLWKSKSASVISDNTISFNKALGKGWGGGIELTDTQGVRVIHNTIQFNSVENTGGGIDLYNCTNIVLTHNVITHNDANLGGGIYFGKEKSATLGSIDFINNTVTQNSATYGSGVYSSGEMLIKNTIAWDNRKGNPIYVNGGVLTISYSDIQRGEKSINVPPGSTLEWEETNIDADPLFADSVNYYLSENSPCIDAGDPATTFCDCPDPANEDMALFPAMGTLRNDMGAYGGPADSITAVESRRNRGITPQVFTLLQNYPNPFNPSTTIDYELPHTAQVKLVIYDMLGRQVKKLVNEQKMPGHYSIIWDGTNKVGEFVAAGLYFCRMKAEEFTKVIKLALVR